jgi:hypothetical protein
MSTLQPLPSWQTLLNWHISDNEQLQALPSKTQRHWLNALMAFHASDEQEQGQYFEAIVSPIKVRHHCLFFSFHRVFILADSLKKAFQILRTSEFQHSYTNPRVIELLICQLEVSPPSCLRH